MKNSLATSFINVEGTKLAYYKTNRKQRNTIVLIHGYCGSSAYFHKLIPLLETEATVIAFDLFGHGQSDALSQEHYNLDEVARLLHVALMQIEPSPVYMLGHSLGGYITLSYAKQFIAQLSGFGLLHSTAYPDSEQAKDNRLNVINNVKREGVATFTSQLATKLFGNQATEEDIKYTASIGLDTTVAGVVGFAHAMREREDAQHIITHSTVPVLLVAGDEDKIVTPEAVFAGAGKEASCHHIRDAGHMGMLESPEEMAHTIHDFIGKRGSKS